MKSEALDSIFKITLKLYNGPYIDDWILLNLTLAGSQFKSHIRADDNSITLKGATSARLSSGKYFDILYHKTCRVDNLILRKIESKNNDINTANHIELIINNSTCLYEQEKQ